jgi:transcriptional regulator with XRE-family HTH domain
MSTMTFATQLRTLRRARKLTQRALANRCRIYAETVCVYENGKRSPTLKTAIRLAAALNVSLDELAGVRDATKDLDAAAVEFASMICPP